MHFMILFMEYLRIKAETITNVQSYIFKAYRPNRARAVFTTQRTRYTRKVKLFVNEVLVISGQLTNTTSDNIY